MARAQAAEKVFQHNRKTYVRPCAEVQWYDGKPIATDGDTEDYFSVSGLNTGG